MIRSCMTILLLVLATILSPALARESLPETTKDGLQLKHQTELGAVYIRPGASLEGYERIRLVDVYVAFAKDWKRDYNREQMGVGRRITDDDMEKIKEKVASEFKRVFTKELTSGGYQVVDENAADVMLLRPAIINLEVTAPDLPSVGMTRTIVRSTGSMTLYAELYDSVTSEKFAEVIDAEEVGGHSFAHEANRGTNQAELDRTLASWANILRKRLDEAHQASAAGS